MAGIVLTDSSPLIGLARIDGLSWLPALFGKVHLPPEVWAEVTPTCGHPDADLLHAAHEQGWLCVLGPTPDTPELPDLDEGEAACIRHALAHHGSALLLMDERAGRAIATEHGLRVAGTAAVIGMARQRAHRVASRGRVTASGIAKRTLTGAFCLPRPCQARLTAPGS